MKVQIQIGGVVRGLEISEGTDGVDPIVLMDGVALDGYGVEVRPNTYSVLLNGVSYEVRVTPMADGRMQLHVGTREYVAEVVDPRAWRGRRHGAIEAEGRQQVTAPMPGKVVRILVKEGEAVEAGQGIIVVEAMKMQNEIRSPKNGKVERLLAKEGQAVNAGEALAWIE
jgi:biotin carboxyl carrier protein